jgi:hypothetical protein
MVDHAEHKEMVPALDIEDAVRKFPEVCPSNRTIDLGEAGWIASDLLQSPVEIVSEGEIQADSLASVPSLRIQNVPVRR